MCSPSHTHASDDAICHLCDTAKQVGLLKLWLQPLKLGGKYISFLNKRHSCGKEAGIHMGT